MSDFELLLGRRPARVPRGPKLWMGGGTSAMGSSSELESWLERGLEVGCSMFEMVEGFVGWEDSGSESLEDWDRRAEVEKSLDERLEWD